MCTSVYHTNLWKTYGIRAGLVHEWYTAPGVTSCYPE